MVADSNLNYQALVQVSIDQENFQRLLRRFLMRFSVPNRDSILDALEADVFPLEKTISRELVKYGLEGELEFNNLKSLTKTQEMRVFNLTYAFWVEYKDVLYDDPGSVPYFATKKHKSEALQHAR